MRSTANFYTLLVDVSISTTTQKAIQYYLGKMLTVYVCVCVCVCVCMHAQSCLTLCGPIDCNLPGSSAHGISQTKMGCHFLLQGSFPPGPHGLQVHSLPLAPPGMVVPSNFNSSYLFLVNLAYVHQKKYIRMFFIYLSKNQNQSKYPLLYKLINCGVIIQWSTMQL